jgi:FkbH-like protein
MGHENALSRAIVPSQDEFGPTSAISVDLPLYWLPEVENWSSRVDELDQLPDPSTVWRALVATASTRLDFVRTRRLDRALQRHFGTAPPGGLPTAPVRLAVLGSSTLAHLLPAIRIAALRRGLWLTTYTCAYGQYFQELQDRHSLLHLFNPNALLFAFDSPYLAKAANAAHDEGTAADALQDVGQHLRDSWRLAREAFGCQIIQQTALPVFQPLLGNNEHRLPGSRHRAIFALNVALRRLAADDGIDLLAIDDRVAQDGLKRWHDPVFWHQGKQEISSAASPLYGDLVARLLAAKRGCSAKCLVLDLDNTLWGGVIGDDGVEGIVLGQGSAAGEAFLAFQTYVKDLAKRGVILAVCSKNEEANALSAFERHPEMVLGRSDVASFVANWEDKATNIRTIAHQLGIGLDSLVFVDDSPFERNLVRTALSVVAVPEMPDDPAFYATCLADAGYFENLGVTEEDRERTRQYQSNAARARIKSQALDLTSYLRQLEMKLLWRRFDKMGLQRIVQLINKTNQLNLTTRRYTEAEVLAIMDEPDAFGLQFRLVDRFGDNGVIAVVIGRHGGGDIQLDTWLMSCRVLGRGVEEAMLDVIVAEARRLKVRRLIGVYIPTAKNAMVRHHYSKLGFALLKQDPDGTTRNQLDIETYMTPDFAVTIATS